MKERPIIFTESEMRAILKGDKTQTRKIMKPQIVPFEGGSWDSTLDWQYQARPSRRVHVTGMGKPFFDDVIRLGCPYGKPGDLLWVKEAWAVLEDLDPLTTPQPLHYIETVSDLHQIEDFVVKSPIYMPRWASRLTLEITNIRIEQLQDISGPDCWAEGIKSYGWDPEKKIWFSK